MEGAGRWAQPWTLADYDVFPEVTLVGVAGLAVAGLYAVLVHRRRTRAAAAALVTSAVLLAFPFFAGLTEEGARLFWAGPLLGAVALVVSRSPAAPSPASPASGGPAENRS